MKNRNFRKMNEMAGLFILLAFALIGCTPPRTPLLPTAAVAASKTPAPSLADTATVASSPLSENTPTPIPAALPLEITDAKGVPMRLVPAGPFTMGSNDGMPDEKPPHTVNLPAFYMDKYEVTNAYYKGCVDAGICKAPYKTDDKGTVYGAYGDPAYNNYPVIWADWNQANTYCAWRGARLPGEAEWEKAARGANDERKYPWGNTIDQTFANYGNAVNANDGIVGKAVAVGSYSLGKSPYGIYDMAGNVWEWTADWYDVYPGGDSTANDAFGQKTYRVLRGGGWSDDANLLRTTFRGGNLPDTSTNYIGFRCALSQ